MSLEEAFTALLSPIVINLEKLMKSKHVLWEHLANEKRKRKDMIGEN
jgi:flagellar assembly factor FliW